MNTEDIIKFLLIIGVIYLIFNCYKSQENFSYDLTKHDADKPVDLSIFQNDIKYLFVSFIQLKDELKKAITDELVKNEAYVVMRENILDVPKGKLVKIPIFLVKESQLNEIADSNMQFKLHSFGPNLFALKPIEVDKGVYFVYHDTDLKMLYYSNSGKISQILKINKDGFEVNKNIVEKKIGDKVLYLLEDSEENKIKVEISQK
jgi:hypothetical protein